MAAGPRNSSEVQVGPLCPELVTCHLSSAEVLSKGKVRRKIREGLPNLQNFVVAATVSQAMRSSSSVLKSLKSMRLTNPTYHFATEFAEVGG